jgi:WD40 repeat protein
MKTSPLPLVVTSIALLLPAGPGSAIGTTNSQPTEIVSALAQVQAQLTEQSNRIQHLYRVLAPELKDLEERAAELEQQEREDQALALERIREVEDSTLTAIGSANPAKAQFGVITEGGGVRIFDFAGNVVKELRQAGQEITSLAFSPKGTELLTGTAKGDLLVWNTAEGTCSVLCTNLGRKVDRVTWLGDDRVAWAGYQKYWEGNNPVDHNKPAGAVLSREDGRVLWIYRSMVRDDFQTLAAAPDGSQLVVLEIPGQPRGAFLLDGATGAVRQSCYDKEHGSGPLSAAISPDGQTLAVGYAPYDIILWNARNGEKQTLLKGHGNWVVSLAFSADNKHLISGAGDSTARVWNLATGAEVGRLRFRGECDYVEGVGFSPQADVVFAVTRGMLVVARASLARRHE